MRATMLAVLFLSLLGAVAMSDTAIADEPKSPTKKDSYDLKATVRKWDGKKFLKPVPNQSAFLVERNGKTVIYLFNPAGNTMAEKGSEITIGDTTYTVEKGSYSSGGYYESTVSPKPKDK